MLVMAPIVFVGIVGNQHEAVEKQLEPSLDKVGVTEMAIPDSSRAALVKHTKTAKQVVKNLHVGGVIAGQLTGAGNNRSFRVIIYDAEGNLTSDLESPIGAKKLSPHNIDVFETNISDIAASGTPAPAAKPTRMAKQKAAPAHDEPHLTDDDAPPGMPGSKPAPAPSKAPVVAAADDDSATATADAPAVVATAPAKPGSHALHVEAGVLVGMVGRSLSTDPNTFKHYDSTPVGTAGVAGTISIGSRLHVGGSFEHTLVMHTDVGGMNISSNIGRAEATASYDVVHGSVQLAPVVGIGERYFAVDSDPTADRTPDLQYVYVVLGATVGKQLSPRWSLHGLAAFEPVLLGVRPAALPEPSRWGVDFGVALDVKATAHVYARAAFDYQLFQSTYQMGNAVDTYPGGSIALGASL